MTITLTPSTVRKALVAAAAVAALAAKSLADGTVTTNEAVELAGAAVAAAGVYFVPNAKTVETIVQDLAEVQYMIMLPKGVMVPPEVSPLLPPGSSVSHV